MPRKSRAYKDSQSIYFTQRKIAIDRTGHNYLNEGKNSHSR